MVTGGRATVVAAALLMLTVSPNAAAAARRASAAPPGSVLTIPFPRDDGTLTPYTFDTAYPLVNLIYDTLLWRDPNGVAQPWLARSIGTSPDAKTITIHLTPGVRWQDGVELTAADVAFTLAYVRSHYQSRFTPPLEPIISVATPDERTVVLTLSHPAPGLVDEPLADLPILPAHLWGNLRPGVTSPPGLPIGSGPYRLVQHIPGVSYRFDANTSYFRGPPSVATIEVPIIGDAEQAVEAAAAGRADMLPFDLTSPLATRLEAAGERIARGPSYEGVDLLFNVRSVPFNQTATRRAVASALGLRQIAAAADHAVPAVRGWIHPASPWSSPNVLYQPDPTAARQALAAAGLATIDVLAPDNDPDRVTAARQVTSSLRAAGASAQTDLVSQASFDTRTGADGSPPNFQLAIGSIPALASYDPNFLAEMFGSGPTASPFNASGYASASFDHAAAQVATTTDPAVRHAAVNAEQQVLAAEVPAVPLFFAPGAFAYRARAYDGWVFVKGTGIFDKQSFLGTRTAPGTPAPAPPGASAAAAQPASGGGPSPLAIAAIAAFVAAGALAVFGLTRRTR
ncbi:MAG: ABC transporter substrate-binding protein [Acidimicrobiales bacterium]